MTNIINAHTEQSKRLWEDAPVSAFIKNLCRILHDLKQRNKSGQVFSDNLLVLDIETLGLDYSNSRIIQIGFLVYQNGKISADFHKDRLYDSFILKLNKTDFIGKEGAIKVHGITFERSQQEGKSPQEVIKFFYDVLQLALRNGWTLIGHNLVQFDLPFLVTEFKRAGFVFSYNGANIVDTGGIVKAAQIGMRILEEETPFDFFKRVGSFRAPGVLWSLTPFCSTLFKIDDDSGKAHDAGYDCYLTFKLLQKLRTIAHDFKI